MNRILFILLFSSVISTCGCRAGQLQHDQDQIRIAIIDMYSNQVMDNLIRAHCGHVFVQVDYTSATGTISQDAAVGLLATFPDVVSDFRTGQTKQLTVSATPVLNNDAVYAAYLKFAGDPEKFIVSCDPPPAGLAHICACHDECYYWIPVDQKKAYQNLALRTTVMRGSPTATVRDYYVAKIQGVVTEEGLTKLKLREANGKANAYTVFVKLDVEVPNAAGKLDATVNGSIVQFEVAEISDKKLRELDLIDADTLNERNKRRKDPDASAEPIHSYDVVQLKYTYGEGPGKILARTGDLFGNLPGQSVKIEFFSVRPSAPDTPESNLDAIRRDVELFRLNQQR